MFTPGKHGNSGKGYTRSATSLPHAGPRGHDGRHHRGHTHCRQPRQIRKDRIPNATYCEPQIGSIGLTERQAREAGYAVKVGKFPFVGNSKATILGNHGGFIKVVSEEKHAEVLGIHIIGPLATEILSEAAAVLNLEGTIDDLMNMVHAHPTVWEAMGDAFASVRGLQINV